MDEELDSRLVGELLALVVHDLRNPLSALGSILDFLEPTLPAADADSTGALRDAFTACDDLSYQLTNLSVIAGELREQAIAPTPFLLAPLVRETVHAARLSAATHSATIEVDEASLAAVPRVFAARSLIERSLACLVRNSIQHGRGRVRIAAIEADGRARLQVHDDGPALSTDLVEAAFTARGQPPAKEISQGRYGRGLGLYVARLAARAAGGEVHGGAGEAGRFELVAPLAPR